MSYSVIDREEVAAAYALLWHFQGDGTPNSKLVMLARKKLMTMLSGMERQEAIQEAKATCNEIGAAFDPHGAGP